MDEVNRRCTVCRQRIIWGMGRWLHRDGLFLEWDHEAEGPKP